MAVKRLRNEQRQERTERGACFVCGETGHQRRDCPQRTEQQQQPQLQQPPRGEGGNTVEHISMANPVDKEYTAFEDKVKRTVYIDDLSPAVTAPVLKTALGQFGNVTNVQFIPNYRDSMNIPQCALVEMETSKQAKSIVSVMANYPFMMSGMPRPVRARAAEAEMFVDRPRKPGRKIQCRWVDPKDPDFEVAKKLKLAAKRHATETSLMLKLQLEEEEKLAKQQDEVLKANYKKYEMIDNLMGDGTLNRLARRYNLNISDD